MRTPVLDIHMHCGLCTDTSWHGTWNSSTVIPVVDCIYRLTLLQRDLNLAHRKYAHLPCWGLHVALLSIPTQTYCAAHRKLYLSISCTAQRRRDWQENPALSSILGIRASYSNLEHHFIGDQLQSNRLNGLWSRFSLDITLTLGYLIVIQYIMQPISPSSISPKKNVPP